MDSTLPNRLRPFVRQTARVAIDSLASALRMDVPLDTIRSWDQGKRHPTDGARPLLNVGAWTSRPCIVSMQYTSAALLANAKEVRDDGSIVEIVIWELPAPLSPCLHRYKYRLYYGVPGECRVRYDNERGKGDHRHFGEQEGRYVFSSMEQLLDDFRSDVERWR